MYNVLYIQYCQAMYNFLYGFETQKGVMIMMMTLTMRMRRRWQRLSGRSVSTLPNDRQATPGVLQIGCLKREMFAGSTDWRGKERNVCRFYGLAASTAMIVREVGINTTEQQAGHTLRGRARLSISAFPVAASCGSLIQRMQDRDRIATA